MLPTPLEFPVPRVNYLETPPLRHPPALWPATLAGGVVITLAWLYALAQLLAAYQPPEEAALTVELAPLRSPAPPSTAAPPKPVVKSRPKPRPKPRPKAEVVPAPVATPPPEPVAEPEPEPEPQPEPAAEAPPPAPAPTAPQIVPLFRLTQVPTPLRRPDPVYPKAMEDSGIEGRVKLKILVGADGGVQEVQVMESGGEAFDTAAVDAVRTWKFSPGMMGNKPVGVWFAVPIVFKF